MYGRYLFFCQSDFLLENLVHFKKTDLQKGWFVI